jgi:hypothetical protein
VPARSSIFIAHSLSKLRRIVLMKKRPPRLPGAARTGPVLSQRRDERRKAQDYSITSVTAHGFQIVAEASCQLAYCKKLSEQAQCTWVVSMSLLRATHREQEGPQSYASPDCLVTAGPAFVEVCPPSGTRAHSACLSLMATIPTPETPDVPEPPMPFPDRVPPEPGKPLPHPEIEPPDRRRHQPVREPGEDRPECA